MEKFVPKNKMSKKRRAELDRLARNTWGNISPVTRYKENGKAYSRKGRRAQQWKNSSLCSFSVHENRNIDLFINIG